MREIIGVESWVSLFGIKEIVKRDALFFDKIAIPHLSLFLNMFETLQKEKPKMYSPMERRFSIEESIKEAKWLLDNGFLFETNHQFDNQQLNLNPEFQVLNLQLLEAFLTIQEAFQSKGSIRILMRILRQLKKTDTPVNFDAKSAAFFEKIGYLLETTTRLFAIQLRELENLEAYPILWREIKVKEEIEAKKTDVVQITLNVLPMPDENASWEHIKDFRSDGDSKQKFLDLRNWMNEVARAKLSPIEVEQKLEYLVNQYQKQLRLHNLKTNTGTFETIIVSGAEIIEELLKFKFSKIAKALFSLKHRKISLMEGEINAKGSEVAYIIKAQDKF
jgi:hypothetical protein